MPTETRAHEVPALDLECGTVVPMRYMNPTRRISVVSEAGWSALRGLEEQRVDGEAVAREIARCDSKVARAASGSPSRQNWTNRLVEQALNSISRKLNRQVDLRGLRLREAGEGATFLRMLREHAQAGGGEGGMHDTAMLFGALDGNAIGASRRLSAGASPPRCSRRRKLGWARSTKARRCTLPSLPRSR